MPFKCPNQSPLAFPNGLSRAHLLAPPLLFFDHSISLQKPQARNAKGNGETRKIFSTRYWMVQGRMILSRNSNGPLVCSSHSTLLVKSGMQKKMANLQNKAWGAEATVSAAGIRRLGYGFAVSVLHSWLIVSAQNPMLRNVRHGLRHLSI